MRTALILAATCLAQGAIIAATVAARAASAASLYAGNCAVCHQANAEGVAGQYPPLAGRVDKIAASQAGRQYLADVLVHGMTGQIEAAGQSYVGYMPAFPSLSNDATASILNWLSAKGATKPMPVITAAEIADARGKPLSASAVNQERKAFTAQHPLP